MAGTPLDPTRTKRYVNRGTREWLWVPGDGIADIFAPTRVELETGTNLTDEVAEWSGFTLSTEFVDVPDLGSRVTGRVPGPFTIEDSSMTFYAGNDSVDVRSLFVVALDGAPMDGFMVAFPEGDGPANGGPGTKLEVWPAALGSVTFDGGIDDPSRIIASFAPASPALNVEIPTTP